MKIIAQVNRKVFLLLIPLALFLLSFQYQETNEIIGKWAFPDSPREIEIYEQNKKFHAKIIKVSGNDKKEKVGHIMFKDIVYDQKNKKYIGVVNSPSGITVSGKLVMLGEDSLQISVSKLFIINKSYTLTRIK